MDFNMISLIILVIIIIAIMVCINKWINGGD